MRIKAVIDGKQVEEWYWNIIPKYAIQDFKKKYNLNN